MPQYSCPKCKTKLVVPDATPPGTSLSCPACQARFRTPPAKPAAAAPAAPAAIPLKDEPPPAPAPPPPDFDADDDDNPYVVQEMTDEEKKLAEATKPKYANLKDKFARSARGPAMSLLVMPSNLMVAEGAITIAVGLFLVGVGMFPIIFTDATPSDEELADGLQTVFYGGFALMWGALICYGASNMQNLGSYTWAVAGAVIAILPLLAGVFALITLQDPRVKAGFREPETGPIAVGKKEDEEEEEDEDDDDEDERPKKKKKRK